LYTEKKAFVNPKGGSHLLAAQRKKRVTEEDKGEGGDVFHAN